MFCQGRVPYKTAACDRGVGTARNICCVFIIAAHWRKTHTTPSDKMERLRLYTLSQMRVLTRSHTLNCTLLHLSVVHYLSVAALLLLKVFTARNTLAVKNAGLEKWIFSWINMHITALTGIISRAELVPRRKTGMGQFKMFHWIQTCIRNRTIEDNSL